MWKNKTKAIKWNDFFEVRPNNIKMFKLVPHASFSNQQNRNMWNTLHKAYSLYHHMHSRVNVDFKPFKVTYRAKDMLYFDIVFWTNPNKIEFYFATTETMAKKFKVILENKWKVSLKDAELTEIAIPYEKTNIYELKYLQHDIFSLDTNANQTSTPIASLLSATEEMEEGDFARVSFQMEREGHKKWIHNSAWAYKKTKNSNIPQRPRINGKRGIHHLKNAIVTVGNEIIAVLVEILNAFNNVFSPKNKSFEKKKIEKPTDMINEIQGSALSDRTRNKIREGSVWKTNIRVAVHSEKKFNRDNIGNVITTAFNELDENNQLKAYKLRWNGLDIKIKGLHIKRTGRKTEIIEELNTFRQSKRTKYDVNPNIMSGEELGRLIQLPTPSLQAQYKNELDSTARVETSIPKIFIHDSYAKLYDVKIRIGKPECRVKIKHENEELQPKENGVLTGHSEYKSNVTPICIPTTNPNNFYKGYGFVGGMGSGKDTAIQNFVYEANTKLNTSFFLIDQVNKEGREGMVNGIRDVLPPDRFIDLDFSNPNFVPPLDLSEVMKKLGRRGADTFANELIHFFGDVEGMGQSRKILRTFSKACNGNLNELKRLLEEEDFRYKRMEELKVEGLHRLAREFEPYLNEYEEKEGKDGEVTYKQTRDGQKALDGKSSALQNRLDALLGDDAMYNIFSQPPKDNLDFEKWMKEGKVIILRVPDRILTVPVVKTLVHWITLKIFMTRLLMSTEEQSNGAFVVFNEPQTYLKDNHGLANLMSRIAVQGRKERLGSIFAFHHLGQINEIKDDLISGGLNWFLMKSKNTELFDRLSEQLEPTFTKEVFVNMPQWHSITLASFGDKAELPFMQKMLPPVYNRVIAKDNSFVSKRHVKTYGRSVEEIEKLIEEAS